MKPSKSSKATLIAFWLLCAPTSSSAQGTILTHGGVEYLCYDHRERVELIGTLAACDEWKRRAEGYVPEQKVAGVRFSGILVWFVVGALAGFSTAWVLK